VTEAAFISKNENAWKSLEAFNNSAARRGVAKFSEADIKQFAHLFRLTSHHLAYAQTHFPASHVVPYLNRVVGASHNNFYTRESRTTSDVWKYFTHTFPKAVQETWRFWVLAAALFTLGILFAGFYVAADVTRLHEFMPPGWGDGFSADEIPDFGDGSVEWHYALATASIMTNNIAVSFNAFAGGLLAGVGTVLILIYNGLIVGALFGFFHQMGADMVTAYGLVLPHGVIELMAIFLAGGCGLMLAKGLLLPGEYTRKQSLIMQAKETAKLLPGIILLLVIAGVIEGYFTPLGIDPWIKLSFAGLTGVGLVVYFAKGILYGKA